MTRPARALLDAEALRHNLSVAKHHALASRVMAVVKANAYGHGLAWVAGVLTAADAFAVASLEEGLILRRAGIHQPIVLLEGFFEPSELPLLAQHKLSPVLHHEAQLEMLEKVPANLETVWVKLDTGMHRVGFVPFGFENVLKKLKSSLPNVRVCVMTHFACADDSSNPATREQTEYFRKALGHHAFETSLANSAAILGWPNSFGDWVRPGIMLYGSSPLLGKSAAELGLKPVMTLESALISVAARRKGETIGYGADYRCPEDMPVGIVAIGYGDGYPRHAKTGTPVLVGGTRVPLIGRVSMDMIAVDLRAAPQVNVGAAVELWGRNLPVDEVAAAAGTISYELLCHVAERIPRVAV